MLTQNDYVCKHKLFIFVFKFNATRYCTLYTAQSKITIHPKCDQLHSLHHWSKLFFTINKTIITSEKYRKNHEENLENQPHPIPRQNHLSATVKLFFSFFPWFVFCDNKLHVHYTNANLINFDYIAEIQYYQQMI